jgi:hypothetical protein
MDHRVDDNFQQRGRRSDNSYRRCNWPAAESVELSHSIKFVGRTIRGVKVRKQNRDPRLGPR